MEGIILKGDTHKPVALMGGDSRSRLRLIPASFLGRSQFIQKTSVLGIQQMLHVLSQTGKFGPMDLSFSARNNG